MNAAVPTMFVLGSMIPSMTSFTVAWGRIASATESCPVAGATVVDRLNTKNASVEPARMTTLLRSTVEVGPARVGPPLPVDHSGFF